jgi:DNA modification methylase
MKSDWPAYTVERRALGALQPYKGNARTHSPEQVAQIVASIREWGWTTPILVDEAGTIIAGHGRVLAAKSMGDVAEVPVIVARGWTEAQCRAYVLADNKLTENGGWDRDLLKVEFSALADLGFNLDLTGFAPDEVAGALARGAGLTDPDAVPEPSPIPGAQTGDVWLLGVHRLVCGDSTDEAAVRAALGDSKPHLMVTDPPYGVEYDANWRNERFRSDGSPIAGRAVGKVSNDHQADWREAWALFPGRVAYAWSAGLRSRHAIESLEAAGFNIRAQIIWAKSRFVIGRGDYHFQHEPCWYAVRRGEKSHWAGGRDKSTLWEISHTKSETGHSTQKPVECMKRPIENNSKAGESIYEPFSGSGTTIIAAEMTGRRCLAIEIDPTYVDVSIRRWEQFTGETAMLESTGETLADRVKKAA